MPELNLQKTSSEFLTDISLGVISYPGWDIEKVRYQKIPISEESREFIILGQPERKDAYFLYKPTLGKDPFTETDLLNNEEDQLQDLILRIRTSHFISCRESLANRLVTLLKDAKEEEDFAGVGIDVGSLRNFYNFFQLNTNLRCPTISLAPEYNIYASWRIEQRQVFSVHFLPNGDTRFVIFKPNDFHPEKQIRISGTATTDILLKTVAPYGVWDWISE